MDDLIDQDSWEGLSPETIEKHLPAMFHEVDLAGRAAIARTCKVRTVGPGQVLIADARMPDHLGYVLDGVLGLRKSLIGGPTGIIGILVATNIYGPMVRGVAACQVEALTPARLLTFPCQPLEQLLHDRPDIARSFLLTALDEVDAMRGWLALPGARKIVVRLVSFLLVLCRRTSVDGERAAGNRPAMPVNIPIRRKDLADHLQTTVKSLSRALLALERDGLIAMIDPHTLHIVDMDALSRLALEDFNLVQPTGNSAG